MYGYGFRAVNQKVFGGGGAVNPLWSGLEAYYTADNTPNDATGNGYDGTLTNGATYGTGIINQGFSFDGVNDYVELPRQMFEVINDFSVSFWIKGNGTSTISIFGNQYDTSGFRVDYLSNNKILFRYFNSGGGPVDLTSIGTVSRGTWAFITVTKDNVNGGKIYINGVSDNSDANTSNVNYYNPNFAYPVIGTVQTLSNTRYFYFNGIIDEVGLFSDILTPSEVTELYNSGSGLQYGTQPSYGPLTTDWIAETGESDTTILTALSNMEASITSESITGLVNLYPFCGADATKHSYNFLDTTLNQFTFFGGMTHDANGVTGNATNAYGDNGWIAGSNFSMGIYVEESANLSLMSHIGTYNGSGQLIMMSDANPTTTSNYYNQNSLTGSYFPSGNTTRPLNGNISMGRTSSTDVHTRIKGTSFTGTETQATQTLSPALLARRNTSNVSLYSDFNVRFLYQGALSLADQVKMDTIIDTFQTELSRNV